MVGSAGATLPVFFPTESNPLGGAGANSIVFTVGNLATPTTTTTLTAPNIAAEIGSIDLFNNLSSLISGIDFLLKQLQDALDGQIYGIDLPMIGDALKDRAKFINDLRQTLVAGLNTAFGSGTGGATFVRQTLANLLGDTGAGILKDANSDGKRDINDIEAVATNDAQGKAQRMDFKLGSRRRPRSRSRSASTSACPASGLQASDNSAVQLKLGYDFTAGLRREPHRRRVLRHLGRRRAEGVRRGEHPEHGHRRGARLPAREDQGRRRRAVESHRQLRGRHQGRQQHASRSTSSRAATSTSRRCSIPSSTSPAPST